jgi:Methyltransferase domain
MTIQAEVSLADLTQHARATWAPGDFREVAPRQLREVGARVVRRVGVGRGEDVLDVGCGTGNAALRAALAGGRVRGVDLTPEPFEADRRLAAEAGVQIQWAPGTKVDLWRMFVTTDVRSTTIPTFGPTGARSQPQSPSRRDDTAGLKGRPQPLGRAGSTASRAAASSIRAWTKA